MPMLGSIGVEMENQTLISSCDAFKMRLYGYQTIFDTETGRFYCSKDDYESYIEDITSDYINNQI